VGSATVEGRGGRVVVQDPREAAYDSMPRRALAVTDHAVIRTAREIPRLVAQLAREQVEVLPAELDPELEAEVRGLLAGDPQTSTATRDYSGFTCPDCGGPLYHGTEHQADSYDCLVGHRWSPESLLEEQANAVERALWLAIRSLDERGRLTQGLAEAARQRGHPITAARFEDASKEASQAADVIRKAANGMGSVTDEPAADDPIAEEPVTG
jgi:two-component system chemotaxis response regulator CheB